MRLDRSDVRFFPRKLLAVRSAVIATIGLRRRIILARIFFRHFPSGSVVVGRRRRRGKLRSGLRRRSIPERFGGERENTPRPYGHHDGPDGRIDRTFSARKNR